VYLLGDALDDSNASSARSSSKRRRLIKRSELTKPANSLVSNDVGDAACEVSAPASMLRKTGRKRSRRILDDSDDSAAVLK